MSPLVSIIMGSTSDLPVMEKAAQLLNDLHVPFEMNALSAHRTPEAVENFAKNARGRGVKVIIAAAAGWRRCPVLYHPDASRNPCSHSCHQWCHECCHSCCTNAGFERYRSR